MAIDLDRIEQAPHILDILLQTEDILDSLDVYCYKNWLDGEVVDGPLVRRHWISVSLLYPLHKMPDPRAALRLLKHDIIVEFSKVRQSGADYQPLADAAAPEPPPGSTLSGAAPATGAPADAAAETQFWMIKIAFPRRLLTQMGADLSFYDDEVDVEDVEAAKDSGIDDESGYDTQEQEPMAAGAPPGAPPLDPTAAAAAPMPAGVPPNGF
jgi:hypothetical protein